MDLGKNIERSAWVAVRDSLKLPVWASVWGLVRKSVWDSTVFLTWNRLESSVSTPTRNSLGNKHIIFPY